MKREFGFPIDADTDPNDVGSERIEFITEDRVTEFESDIWARDVGPWVRIR